MRGRRKDARYGLSVPFEGALSVYQDLKIERCTLTEIIALSDAPVTVSELMVLDLVSSGPSMTVEVRVAESTPVMIDGDVQYRLRLAIVG
jgi:hypothetical protein